MAETATASAASLSMLDRALADHEEQQQQQQSRSRLDDDDLRSVIAHSLVGGKSALHLGGDATESSAEAKEVISGKKTKKMLQYKLKNIFPSAGGKTYFEAEILVSTILRTNNIFF